MHKVYTSGFKKQVLSLLDSGMIAPKIRKLLLETTGENVTEPTIRRWRDEREYEIIRQNRPLSSPEKPINSRENIFKFLSENNFSEAEKMARALMLQDLNNIQMRELWMRCLFKENNVDILTSRLYRRIRAFERTDKEGIIKELGFIKRRYPQDNKVKMLELYWYYLSANYTNTVISELPIRSGADANLEKLVGVLKIAPKASPSATLKINRIMDSAMLTQSVPTKNQEELYRI